MNIPENVCPVCKTKNEVEAVVCKNCGAPLGDAFLDPGASTKTTDMRSLTPESIGDWSISEAMLPRSGLAVYIEGQTDPVYIDSDAEFVLGRKVGQTSEGLLDLAPMGGYHLGLSRRHALVRQTERGYELLDLGSVNGTWLNEERLIPHKAYPLTSGSFLRLGRMRLYIVYRPLKGAK
jgi:hypothetical protein